MSLFGHFLIILILISAGDKGLTDSNFNPVEWRAGEELILKFPDVSGEVFIFLDNSYGKTILIPRTSDGILQFKIPDAFIEKSGLLKWILKADDQVVDKGKVTILPLITPDLIENYLGPRSIRAGGHDYSVLVSIPTDRFDNPLSDGNLVEVSQYFQSKINTYQIPIRHGIAWKRFYSKEKVGKIIISTSCKSVASREMITEVYPSFPSPFTIRVEREHDYADGNQVTQIITSPILDEFGNLVSDGTAVEFWIRGKDNVLLKTIGTTINGLAMAGVRHPEIPQEWRVRAGIAGLAQSNELILNYKPVIQDLNVNFDEQNRLVKVGPLKSFLGQLVPDGTRVQLSAFQEGYSNTLKLETTTVDGKATFRLPVNINWKESYTFKIKALGLTKIFE